METVRGAATALGVHFRGSVNVTAFTKDSKNGPISGVSVLDGNGVAGIIKADVFILAAGTGSADLGHIRTKSTRLPCVHPVS